MYLGCVTAFEMVKEGAVDLIWWFGLANAFGVGGRGRFGGILGVGVGGRGVVACSPDLSTRHANTSGQGTQTLKDKARKHSRTRHADTLGQGTQTLKVKARRHFSTRHADHSTRHANT